jgi:hypothetical protein
MEKRRTPRPRQSPPAHCMWSNRPGSGYPCCHISARREIRRGPAGKHLAAAPVTGRLLAIIASDRDSAPVLIVALRNSSRDEHPRSATLRTADADGEPRRHTRRRGTGAAPCRWVRPLDPTGELPGSVPPISRLDSINSTQAVDLLCQHRCFGDDLRQQAFFVRNRKLLSFVPSPAFVHFPERAQEVKAGRRPSRSGLDAGARVGTLVAGKVCFCSHRLGSICFRSCFCLSIAGSALPQPTGGR